MNDNNRNLNYAFPTATAFGKLLATGEVQAKYSIGQNYAASVVEVKDCRSIVTVKIETTTPWSTPLLEVPVIGAEYIRYPLKLGDKGILLSCSVPIGQITGLGGDVDTSPQGNLSALFFVPMGNIGWSAESPDQVTSYAPNGTKQRVGANEGQSINLTASSIAAKHTGEITAKAGGSVEVESGGAMTLKSGAALAVSSQSAATVKSSASILLAAPLVTIASAGHTFEAGGASGTYAALLEWCKTHTHPAPNTPPSTPPPNTNLFP